MMKIRLTRCGRKKLPCYRVVAIHSKKMRDGKPTEFLGSYNPLLKQGDPKRVEFNRDRIEYWLKVGAKPTDIIARLWENYPKDSSAEA